MPSGFPDQPAPSGTPLDRKLGIKEGMVLLVLNTPKPYREFFEILPDIHILEATANNLKADLVHLFAVTHNQLETLPEMGVRHMKTDGALWVSWPKKASPLPSEIGKFDVMQTGQAFGLVDVKVASIDADWSGHKFVIPLAKRKTR
ncbi:hypothetical protein [Robiginitalea sp. IMCC43444]|uniref:hypothetical protein n=1 Tax=Robiginitalea sp. IMCC43444 TaxID=3459121 RepID=UPI0040432BCF